MSSTRVETFDPRRWRALFVLLLGQFLALIDLSVTNVGLPSICGRLGDTLGRWRLFLVEVAGFLSGTALALGIFDVARIRRARLLAGCRSVAALGHSVAMADAEP